MNLLRWALVLLLLVVTAAAQESAGQPNAGAAGSAPPAATTAPPADTAATAPAAPKVAPEFARLRVYRHKRYVGSALEPPIFIDGKEVAKADNGRYFTVKLMPGKHTIKSNDKGSAISLDVKPGEEYFVRVDIETGFWKGHGKLTLVMPEQGRAEYIQQKPLSADKQLAKDMLEPPEAEAPK